LAKSMVLLRRAVLVTALAAAGCGAAPAPAKGTPVDAGSADVEPFEAAAHADAPAADAGSTAGAPYVGYVGAVYLPMNTTSRFEFDLSVFPATLAVTPPSAGGCSFYPAVADAADAGSPDWTSAGTVTLQDGANALATLTPGSDGSYPIDTSATLAWSPGDLLTVSASGATVAKFSASTKAPSPIAETDPPLDEGTTIPTDADFTLSWVADPMVSGDVVAFGLNCPPGPSIQCTTTESPGHASVTVPHGLLAILGSHPSCDLILERAQGSKVDLGGGTTMYFTAEVLSVAVVSTM